MDGARDSSNDYEGTLVVSPETETGYCYPVKVVQRLIVNLGLFLLPRLNLSALTCKELLILFFSYCDYLSYCFNYYHPIYPKYLLKKCVYYLVPT